MRTGLRRSWIVVPGVVAGCAGGAITDDGVATRAIAPAGAATPSGPRVDDTRALVELYGAPLSTYAATRPPPGKKIDFDSATVKAYRAQLVAVRNAFKAWLRANAPTARVTGEYDIALNAVAVQLNHESLATIASSPLVVHAEYEGLYYPTSDPDLSIIDAAGAWAQGPGGAASAGAGVKVAVLDTGIDITHPCFDDTGYPPTPPLGDPRFTNDKVIAARVFNNKTPSRGYTAEAIQAHGTHVAGTIACDAATPASIDGVTIPYGVSGVAPRAVLGNYNIFPGGVANARSEDILDALEAAYADGFDVANLSLGGGASGIQDLLTVAVDDLDQANMVVAVAAGNSGPGHYTVESPGSAARALTAGASTVNHFIGVPISANGSTFGAQTGQFATVGADLTAPLAPVFASAPTLSTACSAIGDDLTGQIALLSRGTCSFSTKIRNAQDAGAIAVIIANNLAGNPIGMAQDGTANQPTIPAYMVDQSSGVALASFGAGTPTTISASRAYFLTAVANRDIMASFSGQGPTDVDFRVKPDVVAPGVNVLSSIPHQFCAAPSCWAFFQGTSMATPHLAGSAALLRWIHPEWSAAEIRSAIVNTADRSVLVDYARALPISDVNVVGAGREDVAAAAHAMAAIDPVSVSFGAVPSGSGKTWTRQVVIGNLTGSTQTWGLSVSGAPASEDVVYGVSPESVTLAAGASAAVTVTMSERRGAPPGDYQAFLEVGGVAHAALYTLVE